MIVTLDVKESMKDNFLNFIATLDYVDIKSNNQHNPVVKKDKFNQFAGIWKDRDIEVSDLRQKAWK